jgi:hypothetical protein
VAVAGPAVLVFGKILSSVTLITTALKTAQIALLAFNATMLANPFGIAVLGIAAAPGAIIGLVSEYKNLQREHQKYTLMTVDQAKKNDFVKGFDDIIAKIKEYGDTLKDEKKFDELLGKSIGELTEKARELGYTIEGNNEEKLKSLNIISLELQGVRDANGQLITYTASTKENTYEKDKNKNTEKGFFIPHHQVGIGLENKKAIDGMFYSKTDYQLNDKFLFGCLIELDEKIISDGIIGSPIFISECSFIKHNRILSIFFQISF